MKLKLLSAFLIVSTCVLVLGKKLKQKDKIDDINENESLLPSNISLQTIMSNPLGTSYLSMMQRLPGMSGFTGFAGLSGQSRIRIKAYVVNKRRQLVVRCCGKRSCYGKRGRNNNTDGSGSTNYDEELDPLCKGPECPLYLCIKDPLMFEADLTTLKIPPTYGTKVTACGKDYVIGKGPKTQEEALIECCSLGMRLLAINNIVELECVKDFLKTHGQVTQIWTSASDRKCESKWGWCSTSECLPKIPAPIPWKSGNPDNFGTGEHCATLTIDGTLNDQLCTTKLDFLCEDVSAPLSPLFTDSTCSEIMPAP